MDIFRFLIRSSRRLVVATFLVTLAGGLGLMGVLVMLRVFLVKPSGSDVGLIWGFFGLGVVVVLARVLGPSLQGSLARADYSRLVARLGRRVLSAPLPILEAWGRRRMMMLFTEDAQAASQANRALALLCGNALVLAGALVVLWNLSGWLFLFAASIAVLDLGSQALLWRQQRGRADAAYRDQTELFGAYSELIEGVKELKLHQIKRDAFVQEVLRPALGSRARGERGEASGGAPASGGGLSMVAGGVVRLLFFLTIGMVLIGFPRWGMASGGEITGYVIIFIFTMQPLEGMKQPVRLLSRAVGALRRLGEFEAATEPSGEEADLLGVWPGSDWKRISMDGVECRLRSADGEEREFVLGPMGEEIRRGEVVLVCGGSGSGKNTFGLLLAGLVTPDAGEIFVDGELVTGELKENYRQLFSVALGDSHIFARPWGLDWLVPNGLAGRSAELLGVERFIEWKEGRLEFTRALEALSTTERRKLALYAAIVEDRPVLVCDEGVAGCDPGFREVFYKRIVKGLVSRGKTVVVVSRHRECPIEHRVIEVHGERKRE